MAVVLSNTQALNIGFNPKFNTPMDGRLVVQHKSDLTSIYTIGKLNTTQGATTDVKPAYAGMIVTVADENKTYLLKSVGNSWEGWPTAADPHLESSWEPVGEKNTLLLNNLTASDISLSNKDKIIFLLNDSTVNGTTYAAGIYAVRENTAVTGTAKLVAFTDNVLLGQVDSLVTAVGNKTSGKPGDEGYKAATGIYKDIEDIQSDIDEISGIIGNASSGVEGDEDYVAATGLLQVQEEWINFNRSFIALTEAEVNGKFNEIMNPAP